MNPWECKRCGFVNRGRDRCPYCELGVDEEAAFDPALHSRMIVDMGLSKDIAEAKKDVTMRLFSQEE